MFSIILALYTIIAIVYITACLFIVYHIVKYSLNKTIKIFTLLLFVSVSAILFLFNLNLFLSANWNAFLQNIFS